MTNETPTPTDNSCDKTLAAFKVISKALEPLTNDQRKRVLEAAKILLGE